MKRINHLILFLLLPSLLFSSFFLNTSQKSVSPPDNETNILINSSNVNFEKILDDFLVNNETEFNQEYSSICALSNDTFAVAWESISQDGSNDGVFATVFNATTGKNITAEFQVNHYITNDQRRPTICSLTEDKVAIAWDSFNQDGSSSGVYARVFNATTGKNITSEFRINHETSDTQQYSSICALSEDTFSIAWQSNGQDGSGYGIYARVFNATTGKNITAELQVNHYTTNNQEYPSICALSNDTFAVAWQGEGQDDTSGIYARVFNATTGKNITAEFRVNYYSAQNQLKPSVCALSNDKIAMVWEGEGQTDSIGIYANVFNATNGVRLGSEFLVNHYTTNDQRKPSICALSIDKFVVSWESFGQDGSDWGVYARACNAITGTSSSSEILVNQYTTNYQGESSISAISSKNFAIVWYGEGQDDNNGFGVYAAIFGAASSTIGTSSGGGGDDDDDNATRETVASYDIYIMLGVVFVMVTLFIQIRKKSNNRFEH